MSNKLVKIYTLSDPDTGEIRYVGKTVQSLYKRFYHHYSSEKDNRYKSNWIKSLRNRGLKPIIELLEEVAEENWGDSEKFYISYLRFLGFRLTNHSLGGLGASFRKGNSPKKENSKCITPIIQLLPDGTFIKEWKSQREFNNFYQKSINYCSSFIDKDALCLGFKLIRKKDYNSLNDYSINYTPKKNQIQLLDNLNNLLEEYSSLTEASKKLGISKPMIKAHCQNKIKKPKFLLKYKYVTKKVIVRTDYNINYKNDGKKWTHNNPVLLLDQNNNLIKEFSSRKEASTELNISRAMISLYCFNRVKKRRFNLKYKY